MTHAHWICEQNMIQVILFEHNNRRLKDNIFRNNLPLVIILIVQIALKDFLIRSHYGWGNNNRKSMVIVKR